MGYLLAVILPPAAVLRYGTWPQCLVNLNLTAYLWLPGVFHAFGVVRSQCRRATLGDLSGALFDMLAEDEAEDDQVGTDEAVVNPNLDRAA
jgi:uncharacterized membrane protein YqaE (UPF0057 family)